MTGIGGIEGAIYHWSAQRQIRYVKPVAPRDANGLVAATYAQVKREFLVAAPLTLHSPLPKVLAGFWCAFRESLLAGPASRAQREAIAQGIAEVNRCPYCADVHSMMLDGATAASSVAGLNTNSMREWALATRTPGAEILRRPSFTAHDAPQMIGTALVFHYLNRMVNVLLGESPLPSNRLLRGMATSTLAKRVVSIKAAPGESLHLLPSVPAASGLEWAKENEFVEGAFARFYAAVEAAGSAALSEEVRAMVEARLAGWNGEDLGLDATWVNDAVAQVGADQQAAARLGLLTAFASYRVDEKVVAEFRKRSPGDVSLISAVAWASLSATRRVANWLDGR